MASLAKRYGNFQLDAQLSSKDEDRYQGIQYGFTTYADDGTYKRTYVELGGRSDHIMDAATELLTQGKVETLSIDAPLASDADILRDKPEAKTQEQPALKAVA